MAKMMLYNGVELPGLMDDTTNYPIQHIYVDSTTGTYMLIAAPKDGATVNPGSDNQRKELPAGRILYSLDSENLRWVERDRTTSNAYLYIRDMAGGKPIWSLSGFYFDGEYLVYPSDPVPVSSEIPNMTRERAFLLGNLLRQGLVEVRREPVAYLYNGVRLPDINSVWTDELKATHPYAYVVDISRLYPGVTGFLLFICDTPLYADAHSAFCKVYADCTLIRYDLDGESWKYFNTFPNSSGDDVFNRKWMLWCSDDILWTENTNLGTVYLAASDPIPVYE